MGIGHGIAFRPQSTQPLSDTGVDTDEELDNSETAITMDADASSAIVAGNVIRIEAEDMLVTSVVTVTVNVERGYANSDAATHTTNQDVFVFGRTDTVLWLPGQDDAFSSTIRDRSGFGNDGAITGATWVTGPKGIRELDFDGASGLVNCGTDASIDDIFDGGGAVEFWVNPRSDGEGSAAQLYSKGNWSIEFSSEVGGLIIIRLSYAFDGASGGNWRTSTAVIPINTYTYILMSYDNGNVANNPIFYVNDTVPGITKVLTPVGTRNTDAASELLIGNRSDGARTHDGTLALVRACNAIPPVTTAAIHYRQERGLFGV